jgi:type VI secretion system ImpC/EvpB family protein
VAPKCSTDAIITDSLEKELGELGFIALCHCPDTELAAFYGNQSVQRPPRFDEPAATANARLSAMLQYMLCVARFAHYLKVLARDKVGSFTDPKGCEEFLHRWLMQYTTSNDEIDLETKAKYPLREARVQIREHPGKPGVYLAIMHLRPHFQLDQVGMSVRLATELAPSKPH